MDTTAADSMFFPDLAAGEIPTNVLPLRPGKTGAPEETEAQKWARVRLGIRRVQAALGAEPAMARIHIKEALHHLEGLGDS